MDGLFIISGQPERPGTQLLLEITLPNEELVIAQALVCWAKKVPANLVRIANKGGMGVRIIRFVSGEQQHQAFVDTLRR